MAYYVKDLTKPNTEYTARGPGGQYRSLSIFENKVNKWLKEHSIEYIWVGEQISTRNGTIDYYLTVSIPDKRDATLFALRWS